MLVRGTLLWQQRSYPVIASLMRLRSQYQRMGRVRVGTGQPQQPISANSDIADTTGNDEPESSWPASATPMSPTEQLVREALQLLNSQVRQGDILSDCPVNCADYSVEVGKVLSVAATFGALTTTERVAEAMQWVEKNLDYLQSPRQLMSICMPLMNLRDGAEGGRAFVMRVLYEPLLRSLRACCSDDYYKEKMGGTNNTATCATSSSSSTSLFGAQDPTRQLQQTRSAIISAFQLCSKLLESAQQQQEHCTDETTTAVPSSADKIPLVLRLQVLAAASLMTCSRHCGNATFLMPLELGECAQCLQSMSLMESAILPLPDTALLKKFDNDVMCVMLVLHAALLHSEQSGKHRVGDHLSLLQSASQMRTTTSLEAFIRVTLQQLPSVMSAATLRDVCSTVMAINKTRTTNAQLIDPRTYLVPLLGSIRPRLFFLAETCPGHFRPMECSQLMLGLSRWETAGVELPSDVLELVSNIFVDKAALVQAGQLMPFLQGLVRIDFSRGGRRKGPTEAHSHGILTVVPGMTAVVLKCTSRALQLSSEGKLSASDAAQVLTTLVHLHAVNCDAYFVSVENLLQSVVERTDWPSDNAHRNVCATTLQSLEAFHKWLLDTKSDSADLAARVVSLRELLLQSVVRGIESMSTPKELVMVHSMLQSSHADGGTDAVKATEDGDEPAEAAQQSTHGWPAESTLQVFTHKVCELAPMCNGYEVGVLATAVARLRQSGQVTQVDTQGAFEVLLARIATLPAVQRTDAKKTLDALRLGQYRGTVPAGLLLSIKKSLSEETFSTKESSLSATVALGRTLLACAGREKANLSEHLCSTITAYTRFSLTVVRDTPAADLDSVRSSTLEALVTLSHVLAQLRNCVNPVTDNTSTEATCMDEGSDPLTNQLSGGQISSEPLSTPVLQQFQEALHRTFTALGDCIFAILEAHRERTLEMLHAGGSGAYVAIETLLTPKQLVMLARSLEVAGVTHHDLLYSLLPEVRDLAKRMDPLEVSLLMNTLTRLGVWNVRLMDHLAQEVMSRVATCELRQCVAILRSIQRSGFLSGRVYLAAKGGAANTGDWSDNAGGAVSDPLESLGQAAVARLAELVRSKEGRQRVLAGNVLPDLVGVVHTLGYFALPPQPTFDIYYVLALKKLVLEYSARAEDGSLTTSIAAASPFLLSAVLMASKVTQVRPFARQRASSKALAAAVGFVEQYYVDSLEDLWSTLPGPKLAELIYISQYHAFLYDGTLIPSCQMEANRNSCSPLPALLSVTLRKASTEELNGQWQQMLQQISRLTVPVPLPLHFTTALTEEVLHAVRAILHSFPAVQDLSGPQVAVLCATINHLVACSEDNEASQTLHQKVAGPLLEIVTSLTEQKKEALNSLELSSVFLSVCVLWFVEGRNSQEGLCHQYGPLLEELSNYLQIRRKQLTSQGAVHTLLGAALYSRGATLVDPQVSEAVEQVASVACQQLVPHVTKPDETGTRVLPEVYRLLRSFGGRFVQWTLEAAQGGSTGDVIADSAHSTLADLTMSVLVRCVNAIMRDANTMDGTELSPRMCAARRNEVLSGLRSSMQGTPPAGSSYEELQQSIELLQFVP